MLLTPAKQSGQVVDFKTSTKNSSSILFTKLFYLTLRCHFSLICKSLGESSSPSSKNSLNNLENLLLSSNIGK